MLNLELEVGDWATWVGSIGTIGAFAVAFIQIHRERSHRQARELREAWTRRREHVDRVSAWIADGTVHVNNGSGHPIAHVRVHDGDTAIGTWEHLPPGLHRDSAESDSGAVHLEFTDVRGDRWSRMPGAEPALVGGPDPI
ncbi:hypothetical protein [Gordonia shandongensis]|uniref:hypothetical protein n=1 Tax=Gordonia shandongensis TaxID=376351 RepID=UPI0004233108|nr:hypothetical protein [Gordonia shandongensis]